MSRIFINYRRQDSEGYVGRLYDHLVRTLNPATCSWTWTTSRPARILCRCSKRLSPRATCVSS